MNVLKSTVVKNQGQTKIFAIYFIFFFKSVLNILHGFTAAGLISMWLGSSFGCSGAERILGGMYNASFLFFRSFIYLDMNFGTIFILNGSILYLFGHIIKNGSDHKLQFITTHINKCYYEAQQNHAQDNQ